jgi:hypothetical protein
MMTKAVKRIFTIVLVLVMLAVAPSAALANENTSLWADCTYGWSNETRSGIRSMMDSDPGTHITVTGPGYVTITWEESVPASTLYIEWYTPPERFVITQYDENGAVLCESDETSIQLNQLFYLEDGACSVSVGADADMDVSTMQIYDADTIPYNYHDWNDTPEKLDFLIISAHPDDDVLFATRTCGCAAARR